MAIANPEQTMRQAVAPGCVRRNVLARLAHGLCALLFLVSAACRGKTLDDTLEIAYASEAKGELRDQLGPKSKVIATTVSGQRLLILERLNRWARVRVVQDAVAKDKPPLEGWMHQRQMVTGKVFGQFQELAKRSREEPSQGKGLIRRLANMRIEPGRNTQVFYQLAPDEAVDILGHLTAAREATGEEVRRGITEPIPEDWLLARASGERAGWILESLAEMTPPMEVSRYRESQRLRAWFEIYREENQGEFHPWYLWATIPKLSGAAHDFEEIRVFVWNPAASRYETAYREKNLIGFLPIQTSLAPGERGVSPEFSFEHVNGLGARVRRSYFMLGRQVRLNKTVN